MGVLSQQITGYDQRRSNSLRNHLVVAQLAGYAGTDQFINREIAQVRRSFRAAYFSTDTRVWQIFQPLPGRLPASFEQPPVCIWCALLGGKVVAVPILRKEHESTQNLAQTDAHPSAGVFEGEGATARGLPLHHHRQKLRHATSVTYGMFAANKSASREIPSLCRPFCFENHAVARFGFLPRCDKM